MTDGDRRPAVTTRQSTEPGTEAGRATAALLRYEGTSVIGTGSVEQAILAIEAEAVTTPTEPTGLREAAEAFVKMLEGVEVTNRETLDLIAAVEADGDARRVPADLLVRGKGHRQKYDPDTSWGAYAERVANAYPALASPGPEPVGYVTCGIGDCDFAVERGEGRTMALHQNEDHDSLGVEADAFQRGYRKGHEDASPGPEPVAGLCRCQMHMEPHPATTEGCLYRGPF